MAQFERRQHALPLSSFFNTRLFLRLAITLGVIILVVLLPLSASLVQQIMVVGLVAAAGSSWLFFSLPPVGLIALIVAALVIPSPTLPGGLNIAVILLGLLLGLWVVDMAARQRKFWLVKSRVVRPLIAFVLIAILSFGVGQLAWFPSAKYAPLDTQLGGLAIFILSAGAFLLTAQQVNDLRWLERMTWAFLAISAVYFVGWLAPIIGPYTDVLFQRGAVANSMFWLWAVSLALSQALFNRSLSNFRRSLLGIFAAAILYIAIVPNADWKSGYVPVIVAVAVIMALRSWRIALTIALAAPAGMSFIVTRAIATDEYSYYSRLDAWVIVLQIAKANLLLGLGPANYYWYVAQIPLRGYYTQFNSHNQYLDVIAQIGLLGLACLIWFAIEAGILGWRMLRLAPSGFAQAYVVGALGGLIGMLASGMLADWFLPFAYNIGLDGYRGGMLTWLFLGGLVSIERIVRRQAREKAALVNPISEEFICLKT